MIFTVYDMSRMVLGEPGADPGAGKGRGTNRVSCRWLGEPDSLVQCCISNNHLLVVSHC